MWRRVRLKLIYVTDMIGMIGMDRYAKLVDGNIFYAPRCKGNVSNYDCSVELMSADGFLPVVESEMPVCKGGSMLWRFMLWFIIRLCSLGRLRLCQWRGLFYEFVDKVKSAGLR